MTEKVEIGGAVLYHGDCLEVMVSLRGISSVITDPPYSSPVAVSFGRKVDRPYSGLHMQEVYMGLFAEKALKTGAKRLLVFCDDDYYPVLHKVFYPWQYRQMAVWDKGRIGLGNGFRKQHELLIHATTNGLGLNSDKAVPSVLRFSPVRSEKRQHGAQKPIELIEFLVNVGGGEIVLDPFMGSGTTGVACANLGRKFIGIEIERKYFDIACERIQMAYDQLRLFNEVEDACEQESFPIG